MDLLSFFAPPPVSPLFRPGGPLDGYNEDLVFIGAGLVLLFLVDFALVRPLLKPGARYFALHLLANIVVVVTSWGDVSRLFSDPQNAYNGPVHSIIPISAITAIHIYHTVFFKLRADEIFHHVVFVLVLCGLAIPYKQGAGAMTNLGSFALSGLPGGIDYLMLVLVKQGLMDKLTEKRLNAKIQWYLRAPLMSISLFTMWAHYIEGKLSPDIPRYFSALCIGLHFWNGVKYAMEAVEGYGKWNERSAAKAKADKTE